MISPCKRLVDLDAKKLSRGNGDIVDSIFFVRGDRLRRELNEYSL